MKNNALVILRSLHKIQLIKLAGITVAFLFLITILSLSPANAEIKDIYVGHGRAGYAFTDVESECSWAYAFLYVSEVMYKDGPGKPNSPSPMAYLEIGIDDWCNGFSSRWGDTIIQLDTNISVFDVRGDLRSLKAKGSGTITWKEFYCWPPCPSPEAENVSFDVTIVGLDSVMSGHDHFRVYENGKCTRVHSSGMYRPGEASGLITGDTFEIEIKPELYPYEPPPQLPGQPPPPPYPDSNGDIGRYNHIQIIVSK